MIFIIMKSNNILNICNSMDDLYFHIFSYIRIILCCSKDKLNLLNDLVITEYTNNYPSNSFKIDIDTFNLLDNNNIKIILNNLTLENIRVELVQQSKTEFIQNSKVESEINLFLPLNTVNSSENMNIYIKSNNKTKEDDILQLKEKIELEKKKLEEQNNNYDKILCKFLENKHQVGLIESKLKIKKEKEEEKKRIFRSDLKIYDCLINEIEQNTRDIDDIPEIFNNKFIIIKKLHEDENYKDYDDIVQYEKYVEVSKNLNLINYQHKTNYDDLFDNNIYKSESESEYESESESKSGSDISNNISDDE
jgi:hypothetical protein